MQEMADSFFLDDKCGAALAVQLQPTLGTFPVTSIIIIHTIMVTIWAVAEKVNSHQTFRALGPFVVLLEASPSGQDLVQFPNVFNKTFAVIRIPVQGYFPATAYASFIIMT